MVAGFDKDVFFNQRECRKRGKRASGWPCEWEEGKRVVIGVFIEIKILLMYFPPQVVLKVIKHCQEEGSSSELVSGILVGLMVGTTLEITNCFPLPKEWDEQGDESEDSKLVRLSVREEKR